MVDIFSFLRLAVLEIGQKIWVYNKSCGWHLA